MSKWLWCGALIVVVVAGVAVVKKPWRPTPPASAVLKPAVPEQLAINHPTIAPPRLSPEASSVPQSPELPEPEEPIVTRPEPIESTREIMAPLPTSGGAAECEALTTRVPRPDLETRRMPYADDDDNHEFAELLFSMRSAHTGYARNLTPHEVREPTDLFSWAGLLRWVLQLNREMAGAEESEEPPLLDPVPQQHQHPPHCPFGGYCPYPGMDRHLLPR
jgi:hypothetical protein